MILPIFPDDTRPGQFCISLSLFLSLSIPEGSRPGSHREISGPGSIPAGQTIEELIHEIEISRPPVIFIPYTPAWFAVDNPDDITRFITVGRDRARKKGPGRVDLVDLLFLFW